MKKIRFFLSLGLVLLVLPVVWADTLDQSQTQGGESYKFYYDGHKYATQSFVPQEIVSITKIKLKLKAITSSIWNPCDRYGLQSDKFDVFIEDEHGNTVSRKRDLLICDMPLNSFGWKEIRLDILDEVEPGETYWIEIFYKGRSLAEDPNFAWERATYDAYANGESETNEGTSSKDFTFEVYGEKPACTDSDNDGYCQENDCNDNNALVHQKISCNYNGNSCGSYQLCVAQCPVPNDDNNCGRCGNACLAYQYCSNGNCVLNQDACNSDADCSANQICQNHKCVLDLEDNSTVLLHPDLFYDIAQELINRNQVNKVFFKNESEEKAEALLTKIVAGLKQVNSITYPIMLAKDYRWVMEQITTINWVDTKIFMTAEVGEETLFISYESTTIEIEEITKIVKETDELVKGLKTAKSLLSAGLSIYYGLNQANGDSGKFLIYTGAHYLYNNVLPHMAIISFIKGTSDFVFSVTNVDPDTLPFPFDFGYDVLDVMTDENLISESLEGQCGILPLFGKTIGCILDLADAFTHPLAWVDNITYTQQQSKIVFNLETKNYWRELIGGKVFIGATVYDGENSLCNLPWQEVNYQPGESKQISFEWNLPSNIVRNKDYRFVTAIWYEFNPSNCQRLADGCYTGGCLSNQENYARFEKNFSLRNNPPILNSLDCNGIFCGDDEEIYEGQELKVTVYGSDIDRDALEFGYEFLGTNNSNVLGMAWEKDAFCGGDGSWDPCNFRWVPKQREAGEYRFVFKVCDDYNCDKRNLTVKVKNNAPVLVSPTKGATVHTPTPTFSWQSIVARDHYQISVYRRGTNEELCCPAYIYETYFRLPEEKKLTSGQEYEWEIKARTVMDVPLVSERWWFKVNCQTDLDCGENKPVGEPVCGAGGQVYQNELLFTCHNPWGQNSYCGNETVLLPKENESCQFGCQEGRCLRGCAFNEPACDSNHNCVDNQCVLKSGCQYNNPACDSRHYCQNNRCKPIACFKNEDCGKKQWVGGAVCGEKKFYLNFIPLYQNQSVPICQNKGLASAKCVKSVQTTIREKCKDSCYQGKCQKKPSSKKLKLK